MALTQKKRKRGKVPKLGVCPVPPPPLSLPFLGGGRYPTCIRVGGLGGTQKAIRGAETKGRDSPIDEYIAAFFALSPSTGV